MTEREALEQKSFSDLVEIAVAFNLFSREEANSKTSRELIAVIAKDEVAPVEPKKKRTTKKVAANVVEEKVSVKDSKKTAEPKPKTKTSKPATKKNIKKSETEPEVASAEVVPVVDVKEKTAEIADVKETPKKKPSRTKKVIKEETKETPKENEPEKVPEVASPLSAPEEKAETKSKKSAKTKVSGESKKTKETKSKKSNKKSSSDDIDKTSTAENEVSETVPVVPVEVVTDATVVDATAVVVEEGKSDNLNSDEAKGNSKKPSRRNSRSKKNAKAKSQKTQDSEVVAGNETSKDEKEETQIKEVSGEEKPEEKKPEENSKNKKRMRSRKRTLSFGQENGEVVIAEIESAEVPQDGTTSTENTEPAVPEVVEPEIQYIEVEGVLSIGSGDKGDFNGFIHKTNYLPGDEDAFVQGQLIRRLGLRRGDYIKGLAIPPKGKEKYAPLKRVLSVNGVELTEDMDMDIIRKRKKFESLTAIYPDEKLKLETAFGDSKISDISTRIIDLFSPIGKGQRGMIVSPPKAGKTVLLKKVANAIKANNPNCHLIVLLIDERPEEVTDMQRSINGEVVYSTFDKKPENHVRVTELVLERAMRLVEIGEDVVILLDSMTRLARAYNLTINPTGRTLSGGLDPGSLYGPKRFFGAARNIENGGSLTIIATALIETGSRMDEVIFEEFKGTGNMEVTLDRKLADRRVFPAIAVDKSGTRREDLLLTPEELEAIWLLRKKIADVDTVTATDAVINFMKKTTTNNSFVLSIKKSFSVDD